MLIPVTTTVWGMEYSVHECPKRHRSEAKAMFPGLSVDDLLIVPTCQVRRVKLIPDPKFRNGRKLIYCLDCTRSFAENQNGPRADR